MPPSATTAWVALYFLKASSEIGCFLRLSSSEEGVALYHELKEDAESIGNELPYAIEWDDKNCRVITHKPMRGEWPL
jgi:hypothetical protein